MRANPGLVPLLLSAVALHDGCSQKRISILQPAAPEASIDAGDDEEGESSSESVEWFLKRRVGEGATELPAEIYAQAREHIARMPRYAPPVRAGKDGRAAAAPHSWIPLGPGNIGARTRSFVIDPRNPNVMYAGAVTGGVFKSTDGGATWNNLTCTPDIPR